MANPSKAIETAIPAQLKPVLGLFKTFGVDKLIGNVGKDVVRKKMDAVQDQVAADMEQDGFAPVQLAKDGTFDSMDRRQVVRGIMFRSAQFGLFPFKGGGTAADILRDTYDDKVVALAGPKIDSTTDIKTAIDTVLDAWMEIP